MNNSQSAFFSRKLGAATLAAIRRANGNYDLTIQKKGRCLNAQDVSLSFIKHVVQNLQGGLYPF